MNELTISCPSCNTAIRLTESLAAPLLEKTKKQYQIQMAKIEAGVKMRQAELQTEKMALAAAKSSFDEQVAARVAAERSKILAEESRKAHLAAAADLDAKAQEVAELNAILAQRDRKLQDAQRAQTDLMRKTRELDDAKREMELTVEKRIQESLRSVREQSRKEAEESLRLKVLEKEATITAMQRKIEELKQKAEQGSQQLQGEIQELDFEATLRSAFPMDRFYPVAKGLGGGDVLHQVIGPTGKVVGNIIWECKRTKNWSDGWLAKLRQDQRNAKADIAIIVSQAVPRHVELFDVIDGVWVTTFRCAVPVAIALRYSLIETNTARVATDGQRGKMERIYGYLTGPHFRLRVQAIVEQFGEMSDDLEKERRNAVRMFSKREQQIRSVIDCTAGLYGDLQGIAGRSLQQIEGLSQFLPDSEGANSE